MSALELLEQNKIKLEYVNYILSNEELQNWERKEYEGLAMDYEESINRLTDYVNKHRTIFLSN